MVVNSAEPFISRNPSELRLSRTLPAVSYTVLCAEQVDMTLFPHLDFLSFSLLASNYNDILRILASDRPIRRAEY